MEKITQEAHILTMTGINKSFPGVRALHQVDFSLRRGEIHAIMGENGAGKSTLIKILTGVYSMDEGSVTVAGKQVKINSVQDAQRHGINTVYQEVNLCPNLTVAENLFLGYEPRTAGIISWRKMYRKAGELLQKLNISVSPAVQLDTCSIAIQQMIAIARAVSIGLVNNPVDGNPVDGNSVDEGSVDEKSTPGAVAGLADCKILILDEPTSSLDKDEVQKLFSLMRQLKAEGVGIIFITHFLDEVYEVCDRITVLRNGELIGEYKARDLPKFELVAKMIGKDLDDLAGLKVDRDELNVRQDEVPFLEARDLSSGPSHVAPFNLSIRKGEVTGFSGLLGSGRSELVRALYGADKAVHGDLFVKGKNVKIKKPLDAINHGMSYLPEDRKADGILSELSVRENIIIALQVKQGLFKRLSRREMEKHADKYIELLNIKTSSRETPLKSLSGGNQQKVILARWLLINPEFMILDEPTRGIDVGTKTEIQKLILKLASEGKCIAFISSELDEMIRTCSRMVIMRDRNKVGELSGADINQEKIMRTIAGGGNA